MAELGEDTILAPTPNNGGVFDRYNTTTVNQSLGLPGMFSTFTGPQLRVLRTLAITASIASIIAGIIGLQLVTFIDKRRKVFRHHMLLLLVVFDLLKAVVLLVYPVVISVRNSIYATPTFFNTVGWLTAYAIEGADIVIVLFAIHFALLIFKPTWKWVNVTTGNVEGGFYQWRRFMYPLAGILPMILASLAFINYNKLHSYRVNNPNVVQDNNNFLFPLKPHVGGYKPMSAWCYLPPYPYWYKLVLSWAPRYIIFISICGIYISIYVYVTRESQKIKRELGEFHTRAVASSLNTVDLDDNRTPTFRLIFYVKRVATLCGVTYLIQNVRNFLLLSVDDSERDNTDGTSGSDAETYAHGLKSFNYGGKGHVSAGDRPINTIRLGDEQGPTFANKAFLDCNKSCFEGYSPICEDPRNTVSCINAVRPHTTGQINTNYRLPVKPDVAQHPPLSFNFSHHKSHSFNTPKSQQSNVFGVDFKDVKQNLHSETYGEFKSRRIQIRRQLKSIFIYPFAYLILWIFPFILDCTQYHHELRSGPIVWLTYTASFMQPLSCVVDVLVLTYRETPWRYSWSSIERKELLDKYALKGELGERTIMELIRSRDGRRGWYYRGKWKKLQCWRYKPQRWKRICWYIGRFLKGLLTNHYDFTDNCHDYIYWDDYYKAGKRSTFQSISLEKNNDHNRDVLLSGSESSYNNNRNGVYKSTLPSDINEVPLWWRILHLHPMLRGIDLDELDRALRLKNRQNDFVIPGLHLALQNAGNNSNSGDAGQPSYSQNNNSHMFGSDYTMDQVTMNGSTDFANYSKRSSIALPPTTTLNSAFNYPRLAANIDLSDATNCSIQSERRNEHDAPPPSLESESRKINILDFLND